MDQATPDREFHRVGEVRQFRRGRGRVVSVDGVDVAVFHTRRGWFAIQDACPHMGASLAGGKIDEHHVECVWHHWRFDLRSGKTDQREWACAAVYEVRIEGDAVFLKPPPPPDPEPTSAEEPEDEDWIFWDAERYFKKKPDPE